MCNGVRIVVVSSDHALRNLIETTLESEGHQSRCVSTSHEAVEILRDGSTWNLLLIDAAKASRLDELFTPALMRGIDSEKVCILSDPGNSSWKLHAQSWNITHVLLKPLLRQDLDRLVAACTVLPQSIESPATSSSYEQPSFHMEELDGHGFFLAACPAMLQVHKNIRILAALDYPVLILGESGVGKEIVARLLHKYHNKQANTFVNVNTAAIPSELLESELFGYEAGAFTGALKAKPGKFELAHTGTLLLDEIGEMSPHMQAKLLHVLQDGTFTRLGGRSATQVNVRILAATNVDMESAISEKRFREDLYYRLNAFTIVVPSLRERREEIPLLIQQMVLRGAESTGQEPYVVSSRLLEAAQEYHWPGNLRELRNFVTRLLVLQDQDAALDDLRAKTRTKATIHPQMHPARRISDNPAASHLGMKSVVSDVKHQTESRMIKEALSATGWNRRRAAMNLNISYRALLYKIQQHGLSA